MPSPASASPPVTLMIVEDDRATREMLLTLVASEERLRCLSAYGSGEEAIAAIPASQPDVVLLDINLPGKTGIDCIAQLKALSPRTQILMLTTFEESDKIFRSLRAGANGYLLKKRIDVDLVDAIEQVRTGGAPMSAPVARKVVAHFHHTGGAGSVLDALTTREREILELLANGCLYKQIGSRLNISLSTVRTHLRSIYEKLQVESRTQATVKFLQG